MSEQQSLIPLSPGERLRQARESKGWSLATVAARLKCSEEVLIAIEADNHTRLAPVYQRGFTRRYAELMGIPAGETADWLENAPTQGDALQSVFQSAPPARPAERWLKATSYVLASLLVGTLAWQMSHEAVRLSQRGSSDAGAEQTPDLVDRTGETDNHVNASIASLEKLRTTGSRTGGAGQRAWAAMQSAPGDDEPLAPGEHRLALSASADSWVEIRDAEGDLLEQDLVRGGSERFYRGFAPFRVTFGRASAMQLTLDGLPVDIAAHSKDDVTQMLLDPAAVTPTAASGSGDDE